MICYCSLIFVDISADDTAITVQDDNVSNSSVNSGLSMYSSCVFHSGRIIVFPSLECFCKMTQEKLDFTWKTNITVYVPITMEFVVLVVKKCSELSMMKVVFWCSQSTYRNFNLMAEVNNAYNIWTTHLNLTEIETGIKYPFSVEL